MGNVIHQLPGMKRNLPQNQVVHLLWLKYSVLFSTCQCDETAPDPRDPSWQDCTDDLAMGKRKRMSGRKKCNDKKKTDLRQISCYKAQGRRSMYSVHFRLINARLKDCISQNLAKNVQ